MEKRNLFPTWTTGSAGGRDLGPGPGPGPASTLANVTRSTSTRSTSTRTNSRRRRIMAAASPRAPRLRILIPKNELSFSTVLGPNILVYKVSGFYPVLKQVALKEILDLLLSMKEVIMLICLIMWC